MANPNAKTLGAVIGVVVFIALAIWWFKRRLSRTVLD
jgi:flagellar biogenesis protein FliO